MLSKKRLFVTLLAMALVLTMLPVTTRALPEYTYDGEVGRTTETIYEGVTCTHVSLGAESKYKQQEFWVVEFDPKQEGLSVDVTMGAEYATQLRTVQDTVTHFNETNGENKVAISAINGDLWMVSYAHARVEGSGTEYGGYKDAVVTKSLTLPRGLNIYNGEIITSPHTSYETPYEGAFDCFGITDDGESILGTPSLVIDCVDVTQNNQSIKVNGLNRLPADKAIMLYSNRGCPENNSLADAYEIVIDCDEDYRVTQGSTIRGKVTAICKEGDENPKMQSNRFILCARGKSSISKVEGVNIGDEIEFSFSLKVPKKDQEIWSRVTNAVGGHMKLVVNGRVQGLADATAYPTSIIGNTKDGKIIFMTADGRQPGYSVGLQIRQMGEILVEMGVENAFLLDGGGSATMVNINEEGGYDLVNHPCDKDENGNFGQPRTVVNSIILSYTKAAEETEAPAENTPDNSGGASSSEGSSGTGSDKDSSKGCGSVLGGGTAFAAVVLFGTTLCFNGGKSRRSRNKKER